MESTFRSERGIAMIVAIFALVVVGGIVSGAFFLGMQEQQVGRNTIEFQQAFAAADGGAQYIVTNWSSGTYNQLDEGDSLTFTGQLTGQTGWYRGSVRRINQEVFLVRAEGFSRDSMSRQQVGVLVRLRPFQININSALKTQGSTRFGGSSYIDGSDNPPPSWPGCTTKPTLPALRIADSTDVSFSGCNSYSCLNGDPKIQPDTTINDSSLTTFGDIEFDEFAAMASKTIGAGPYNGLGPTYLADGSCNTGDVRNWGDPDNSASACGSYFPIVYSPGDTKITGGAGQGILIVNGDLEVQGGARFYGPVIVRGRLRTAGTGGHFNGGVIAANVDLEQNTVLGNAVISYSSCAVERALNASAPAAQMRERGWVNLN